MNQPSLSLFTHDHPYPQIAAIRSPDQPPILALADASRLPVQPSLFSISRSVVVLYFWPLLADSISLCFNFLFFFIIFYIFISMHQIFLVSRYKWKKAACMSWIYLLNCLHVFETKRRGGACWANLLRLKAMSWAV